MRYTSTSVIATSLASVALVMILAGCAAPASNNATDAAAGESTTEATSEPTATGLTGDFVDPTGADLGTVQVVEAAGVVQMTFDVEGMPPGFHALHVHSVGLCEPDSADPLNPATVGDFLSAGGHVGAESTDHGQHAGDLPSLVVAADGTGRLVVETDAVTLEQILDTDGSAVMVHAGLDNFANLPERYAPGGPDEVTLNTGDAGGRIACAVITE